ncbi:MAG TPA: methyltransferase domain-containing protein [Gemmatimonadaceae bacterium]|nr:methyltransferase domain-containing protein [Gemmatimonadaceae bacterium]
MAPAVATEPERDARAAAEPWQLSLYRRSIKKKETMRAIFGLLPDVVGKRCLEVGCGTGTSSWLLRRRGGEWVSTDFEAEQVESARQLVGDDVQLIGTDALPFPDASFDVVVGINFLEHLTHDVEFVQHMTRVLKPGGYFLLTCPEGVPGRLGYRIKQVYGFTSDSGGFGHVRDGYSRQELERLMSRVGLRTERIDSYSRLFTELVENSLNFLYHRAAAKRQKLGTAGQFHGETAPATGEDLKTVGWKFRAYQGLYPLLRGFSLLDRLIPFSEGYMFCVRARKPLAGA